jgi:hypothetical protein
VSAHRDALEAFVPPVVLSSMPPFLELPEKREPTAAAASTAVQPHMRRVF